MKAISATPREVWRTRQTAGLIMGTLSSELYADEGACLWELVRNGVIACMREDAVHWEPGVGEVELQLVPNHPLAPASTATIVFDRGCGFTGPNVRRYCDLGASLDDLRRGRGTHGGGAQKRVGRFAALALNETCRSGDPNTGFYVLTRTSDEGLVTFVTVVPSEFEREQGFGVSQIGPNAAELGHYRGISGSFSMVVIPNSVFTSVDAMRKAIQWYVPRKRDRMFRLVIGGKALVPPSLPTKLHVEAGTGQYEAFLDRVEGDPGPEDGVWLADSASGLRVVRAQTLGIGSVPYPLSRPDLRGDIFIPDIYAHQRTDRAGLDPKYLRSAAWRKAQLFVSSQVVPRAKELIGDDDVIAGGDFGDLTLEFADLCHTIYGVPEGLNGPPFAKVPGTRRDGSTKGPRGPAGTPRGPRGPHDRDGKLRSIPIRIGDDVFFLQSMDMGPLELVQISSKEGVPVPIIHLNTKRYGAAPAEQKARREHLILCILSAIGTYKFPTVQKAAVDYMAGERKRMLETRAVRRAR